MKQLGENSNEHSLSIPEALLQHKSDIKTIKETIEDADNQRIFVVEVLANLVGKLEVIRKYFAKLKEDKDTNYETVVEITLSYIPNACMELNLAIGEITDKRRKTRSYYNCLKEGGKHLDDLLDEWP